MKYFTTILLALSVLQSAFAADNDLFDKFPLRQLTKTPVAVANITHNQDGSILLDFGRDAFAQIELTLDSKVDGRIEVLFGEKLRENHIDRKPGGSIRFSSYELNVKKGVASYFIKFRPDGRNTRTAPVGSGAVPILMPEEIGEVYPFRYCELLGLNGDVVVPDTRQLMVHYPFNDEASSFSCSDTVLNKVWDLCKYSIKATSFCGYYVDGDRERIPYEADALLNQLSHYGVDSEYAMARRSTAYLLENPTWPTEWQLIMVFMAFYDYLYTGDKTLIDKYYDVLKAKTLLALRDDNGLISTLTGRITQEVLESIRYRGTSPIQDIIDWPRSGASGIGKKETGEVDGYVLGNYNCAVNAMHCGSLQVMADIASALGKKRDAMFFKEAAVRSKEAVNANFLCADGVYRDGLDTDHRSLHANMFPLMFGLVPDDCREAVIEFIKSRGMACSVYGAQFLLDALFAAGEDDYAVSLMTSTSIRSWYNMILSGSTITMEAWDKVFKENLDWNHAWGAAPANLIPRWVIGVQPANPGFGKAVICPHLGALKFAEALVPTPHGGISCRYENQSGESIKAIITIPDKLDAQLMLPCPGNSCKLTVNGRTIRRFKIQNGYAVLKLKKGCWEICASNPSGQNTFQK